MTDFEYKFTLYFRSKIFENCRILVNDMEPVISAVDLFIKNILLSPEGDSSEITYRISKGVDLYVKKQNGTIKKYKWFRCTNQELDNDIIELDINNINEFFDSFRKEYFKTLKENNILEYPKELFGKAFVCCIEAISDYLEVMNIEGEEDIYNIFKLSNNGDCNILH